MRNFIEKNFKYVGDNLPQEARNIYYDKSKNTKIFMARQHWKKQKN